MLTAKERRRRSRSDSVASAASSLASLSDKENDRRGMDDKGKAPAHGPSAARKRKFGVQGGDSQPTENGTSTAVAAKTKILGLDFYDPDQDMGERRQIRKDYRDLSRELSDSRTEFLVPGSNGLFHTLQRSNELYDSVKQTCDATLDSRLLVSAASLSMKRTTQLNDGDASTGIDIDDFVSKCITFMRRGVAANANSASQTQTQARRRGRPSRIRRSESEESEEDATGSRTMPSATQQFDDGDALDWEWLGRQACCPFNLRPAVPGFLLGPLSVQKRVRRATQRRERLQQDPANATKPEVLQREDLQQTENSNLTVVCTKIRALLAQTCAERTASVEAALTEDMGEEEVRDLMDKHGIADDGGVPFFQFVINPQSFGQTIENLFYVSFLIRDGQAGIGSDSSMLPTLHPNQPSTTQEIQDQGIEKRQAIFHLDFDTWHALVQEFNIRNSIIPHRASSLGAPLGAKGWYG